MRLSDPVLVYGDPTSATHILVQKKDSGKHPLFYSPREVNGKIACYTRFPNETKYFDIRSFAEEDFHEIIKNVHPSELVNIIFCNFSNKNPNEISKNDIYDYISYEEQRFFGYFSNFLTELQDGFTSQRERIDSILKKSETVKTTPEKSKTKDEEQIFKLVEKFDETKTTDYVNKTIDGEQMIITKGVLERYYDRKEIIEYSDQLKPGEIEKIKGQVGYRYTTKFEHPFGEKTTKEAVPPKIQTSIYEYFEPETIYQENQFLNSKDMDYSSEILLQHINNLPEDLSDYDVTKDFKQDSIYLKIQNKKPSVRIKLDPNIINQYPDIKLGSTIQKAKPSIGIVPTNKIVEYIEQKSIVTDLNLNLFPTYRPLYYNLFTKNYISAQDLLTKYLHSTLYNIPIKKIKYKAKWLSGDITELNVAHNKTYQTPFEAAHVNKQINDIYGISIDVSNVAKREDLVDSLRNLLIDEVAANVKSRTTISVEFGERIIVKVEPFAKYIHDEENTLFIQAKIGKKPNIHHFTKQKWNQLYSKWASSRGS